MAGWPTQNAKSTSLRGVGRAQFTPTGDLKVKLDSWEGVRIFKKDKLPASLANRKTLKGVFSFNMNEAKDTLYSIYPALGIFNVRFSDIGMKKDATLPEPFHKVGDRQSKDGHTYHEDYYGFVANLVITDGDNEGMIIPYILRYYFKPFDMDGERVAGVTGIGKRYGDQLVGFLDATGLWAQGPMKYSDNLLPTIQKKALALAKDMVVVMKDGWVDSLIAKDAETQEEDLDDAPVEGEEWTKTDSNEEMSDDIEE